jgi:cell division protein ZapE
LTTRASTIARARPDPAEPGLLEKIEAAAQRHGFVLNASQRAVIPSLERVSIAVAQAERGAGPLRRWFARRPHIRGLYLWGAVGRGKSFLVDEFFRTVPIAHKRRAHFHRFMQSVHHGLRELQGRPEPLDILARRIARETRLLCLDEFHVSDIGDAMLMRGLLEGLFRRAVVLVATSNERPDRLYEHGLQRAQFLPAIALIESELEVLELIGAEDYRLRTLERAGMYHTPSDREAAAALARAFEEVAGESGEANQTLDVDGRMLSALRLAPGVAWFDFNALCREARGTADYIELARRYHTILLSDVPALVPGLAEETRRFTWLVDEFYDRRVKLMLTAEVALERLFAAVHGLPGVERAASRLVEMQTALYLGLPHLA